MRQLFFFHLIPSFNHDCRRFIHAAMKTANDYGSIRNSLSKFRRPISSSSYFDSWVISRMRLHFIALKYVVFRNGFKLVVMNYSFGKVSIDYWEVCLRRWPVTYLRIFLHLKHVAYYRLFAS